MEEQKDRPEDLLPSINDVNPDNFSNKALVSGIDVLRGTQLIKPEDFEFLHDHIEQYEKRFRTRGIFRSKTEMIAGVLSDNEHPTPDSKYWQAIGEQNVHLTELISLSYESIKLQADLEFKEAEIEELEEKESSETNPIEMKKLRARIKKSRVELAQMQFGMTQQQKTAQERLREVKTWEDIIDELHKNLEFGDEDFGLHHGKRYYLRYKNRMQNLSNTDLEARESIINNYQSFAKFEQTNGQVLPLGMNSVNQIAKDDQKSSESKLVELPDGTKTISTEVDYSSLETMGKDDPIAAEYFNRKVRKILVASPHRNKGDRNATNFFAMQTPTAFNCDLDEPFGLTVADARNYIVKKAIDEDYDYIFFVDDDVIIPRQALVQLEHHNADVVGGFYYKKYLPLESVGMHINESNQPIRIENYKIGDLIHNTLVLPSGCTLIKVEALKKLEAPWYKTITVNGRPTLTEDTYICAKFKQVGIDIITDTGIQCIHVDYSKGRFFGHHDIVDYERNEIRGPFREYFAI